MKSFLLLQRVILHCTLLIVSSLGNSQTHLKALQIGEKVPEIPFTKNFNPDYIVKNIRDLYGKVVILDFFNSGCLACLKGVPIMDSLQKRFNEQIQIIMVTDNSVEQVKKFFSRLSKLPSFPIIINDSNFYSRLFPHEGDPLHIWIDRNGFVKAITDHYNTTGSNIIKLIAEDSVRVFKRPAPFIVGYNKRLLEIDREVLKERSEDYSIFFKSLNEYLDFTRLRIVRDSITGMETGLTAINYPLYSLYSLAYSKELFSYPVNARNLINNNRISIRVKNELDLRKNTIDSVYDKWRDRNLISYELNVSKRDGFYSQLQNDLDRFTSFQVKIESQLTECLVLMVSNKKLLNRKKSKEINGFSYSSDSTFYISGVSLQNSLLPHLAIIYQDQPYPVIDETNFLNPLSMEINADFNNIKSLNQEISKYGLILKTEKRKINILIIEDKNK